jgi:hypothetical protein
MRRREILKGIPLLAGAAVLNPPPNAFAATPLSLSPQLPNPYRPLQEITVRGATRGALVVRDGDGVEYLRAPARDPYSFKVSGALGLHTVELHESEEQIRGVARFRVDCATELRDAGGKFQRLLDLLRWTMESSDGRDAPISVARFNDQSYRFFVCWLRDNTHTMKGMKYFYGGLTEAVDLYADTQREDGMIFDNIYRRSPDMNYWDWILRDGNFIRVSRNNRWEMRRQPVEADVEFLFLEALYYTWKATGNDSWMEGHLDKAKNAVEYCTHDPYRWSGVHQLVKRGFTIDTWDFVPVADRIRGQNQVVDPKQTHFGIMYGDNTGLAVGCRYLAEMLEHAGRAQEARQALELAETLRQRVDELCWNGHFYRHHVPEDPHLVRDMGVDQSKQVSLSNAYSLNRGISHDKAVEIIQTYQEIRRTKPASSPGEFYAIYPPFEKGFDREDEMWEYMNGGVLALVAGELAHGAFEHGYEEYGVDILRRQLEIAEKHDGILPAVLRGKEKETPSREFRTADLAKVANVDFAEGAPGVPGWSNEPGNDLAAMPVGSQTFEGVPFEVVDPAKNGRRGCIGISNLSGYAKFVSLPLQGKAASIYLLHSRSGGDPNAGIFHLKYENGETHGVVMDGRRVGGWWAPEDAPEARVAWRGANKNFGNVGIYVTGLNNPHPEWPLVAAEFEAVPSEAKWMIAGLTLSDAHVFFQPRTDVSFGIPEGWGAAAVVYALVEGLAGVKDAGVTFNRAAVSPRWEVAGVGAADVQVRYPASRGYVAYHYKQESGSDRLSLSVAGCADHYELLLWIPQGKEPVEIKINGIAKTWKPVVIEASRYARLEETGRAALEIEMLLR